MTPSNSSTKKKGIALLRVSDKEQADKEGLARQEAQIRAGIARHDLNVTRWVTVIDVSGKHVMHDPQFQTIFADRLYTPLNGRKVFRSATDIIGKPQTVAFPSVDEFSRSKKPFYEFVGKSVPHEFVFLISIQYKSGRLGIIDTIIHKYICERRAP